MQPDTFYHIYNHANGDEDLFREDENYYFFLKQWIKYIGPVAATYAYCLMPNHFHALIKVREEEELRQFFTNKKQDLTGFENLSGLLSKQFGNLFNAYAKAYNKRYDRKGSLFNRPFKAKEIDSDEYLTSIVHYIHHNPIHHAFCNDYESWPHSSYRAFLENRPTRLERDYVLEWFGGQSEFISFHRLNTELPDKSLSLDE